MRFLHHSYPSRNDPEAASTSVVSAGFIPSSNRATYAPDRRYTFAVEKFGRGARVAVSNTTKSQIGQITFFIYALHLGF